MTTTPSREPTLTAAQVNESITLHEVKPGMLIAQATLKKLLPDMDTLLFFAQAYTLDYNQLSRLILTVFPEKDVLQALLGEADAHSTTLQDFIVDVVPDDIQESYGSGHYDEDRPPPDTELLGQLFEQATTTVASSIQQVADKIGNVLDMMTSKYGHMTFQHLHKLNVQRNSIGTYDPQIVHQSVPPRLVVLDVSGSVNAHTVSRIVEEVVGLAYAVNASMAIVSDSAYLWDAGTFDVQTILDHAEYGGTRYHQLTPIFHKDWDTVITIADYDSAWTARDAIGRKAKGHIREVLDISLVNRPTFLAECLGQIAEEVRPLLIGSGHHILT